MVMQVRMMPIDSVFMRFPRMVRDLAMSSLASRSTSRSRARTPSWIAPVIEALGDPLVHLVRNAIDHGLEGPDERIAAGKPATGTITITAAHSGGDVLLTCATTAAGWTPARGRGRRRARPDRRADALAGLSINDAIELLFHQGFSTTAVATDVSGRGVGMDAVRTWCGTSAAMPA